MSINSEIIKLVNYIANLNALENCFWLLKFTIFEINEIMLLAFNLDFVNFFRRLQTSTCIIP